VERLLMDKNKKLETENMQYKSQLSQREEELKDARDKLQKSQETATNLKQLVTKLEEDISKDSNTSSASNVNKPGMEDFMLPVKSKGEDSSMLQIVCSQRDRFKARILDMEMENKVLLERLESRDIEIEALRNDNIKLYEKIKYLQSYGNKVLTKADDIESNNHAKDSDELEAKYSSLYEDTVNPFVIFNRKERYKRYKELSAAEKVVLKSGRFFLSTKFARTFLFFYSVFLHCLVFFTLYKFSHTTYGVCPMPALQP